MGSRYSVVLSLALVCAGFSTADPAASRRQLPAARVSSPPVIDGKLDDACWAALPAATGFTDPVLGTPVADQTVARIGYDDRCIYVAFQCKDSNPRAIVARETRRGASLQGDDQIWLKLNTFRTGRFEDESSLSVNALGTQNAALAGGHATKHEWEGIWQSAARVVDDGWVAEMAIPWRIFSLPQATGGKATLGLNFARYQARTQVFCWWSNLGPQGRSELAGEWVGVELPLGGTIDPLSVLGYALGGYENRGATMRVGADARYQLNPQLTAVASVNPDFSNVEGAVTSIDFSYAERLPAERRPFFLEGAGYYRESGSGFAPFASVRVPQFDLGAKFYGRVARGTDVGLLAASRPGRRSDAVARVHCAPSSLDSVNAEVVTRAEAGLNNTVALVSGNARRGDWVLSGMACRSYDGTGRGDRAGFGLDWSTKHWWAGLAGRTISRLFLPRDGYIQYTDEKGLSLGANYSAEWRTGPLTELGLYASTYSFTHIDGSPFRRGTYIDLYGNLRSRLSIDVSYSAGRFGANRDHIWGAYLRYPSTDKFCNYGASYNWGRQGGFEYSYLSPWITWRFFERLSVMASSEVVRLNGTRTQEVISVSYDLSRKQAVAARLIERSGRVTWYASFRHSGYAGAEYFVILGDPNSDRFRDRLMVKTVRPL